MKKIFFAFLLLCSLFSHAQTTVARYSSGSFQIDLNASNKQLVTDSIKSKLGLPALSLDSVTVDDPSPSTTDSAAYLVFHASTPTSKLSIGFYVSKENAGSDIDYKIVQSHQYAARTWKCETNKNCNHCAGERNWFLGPVVRCSCADCKFSTGGGGAAVPIAASLISLIGVLVTVFNK
ncbi:MAG TPA: hypothetical protein VFR58_08740 [Flavisolibacter sp.]|nr:hypothetical protein [Flavisolibacter sp.]